MARLFVIVLCTIVACVSFSPAEGTRKNDPEMTMQDGMMMIKGSRRGDMMIVGDDCSPIKFMHKTGKGKRSSMMMIMNKGASSGCCKKESGCYKQKKTLAIPVMMIPDYRNDNGGYGGSMGGGYGGGGSMGGGYGGGGSMGGGYGGGGSMGGGYGGGGYGGGGSMGGGYGGSSSMDGYGGSDNSMGGYGDSSNMGGGYGESMNTGGSY